MELLTIIAILTGPIFAVWVTRKIDLARERRERKMNIFRTLMRTRRSPTTSDHVGSLNLIEIEFSEDSQVIKDWRALFDHLGTQHLRNSSEDLNGISDKAQIAQRRRDFDQRLYQDRQKLLTKLLHSMAVRLDFKIEQLEIFDGGYLPQGWVDNEAQQEIARKFLLDLALGRTVLPVGVMNFTSAPVNLDQNNKSVESANDPLKK